MRDFDVVAVGRTPVYTNLFRQGLSLRCCLFKCSKYNVITRHTGSFLTTNQNKVLPRVPTEPSLLGLLAFLKPSQIQNQGVWVGVLSSGGLAK